MAYEYRYPNLLRLLEERHISTEMYGVAIGVCKSTAQNKLRGKFDHSTEEAKKAMVLFPEYKFDYVFEREHHE